MPLAAGTRLGTYEIVAPLGAGGMGEVYRARDSRLGREVAVKILSDAVASSPERLARFEREAKTVASLNHPNIVVLHSIEEANGSRFLTMEMVEGQTLDRLVKPGGLPVARVLQLALPLADALAAAHERGVVHRDLKPANVMVTREGRIKVLDFGLAKLALAEPDPRHSDAAGDEFVPDATLTSPLSTAGQVVGTVPYMAPEQLRGQSVDARADLFSLGIILYELLAGRRPFTGTTSADVTSSILRDPPEPLHKLRPDLPADIYRIIARCLEKDPERRVQTAKDVRNELELVRRTLEAGTAPPPLSEPSVDRRPPPARELPSIAVLPFTNRSRSEEDEYFSDGLADELMTVLAKIPGLRVAARSSSFTFKGKEATSAEVGRALNVASVLEGSVRKAGNRVRISVQLVKVADGYQLWSESYDRTLEDIFAVQDDIAQSVVKELRTTLLGEASDSKTSGEIQADVVAAAKGRGESGEAHRLFLQGRYLIDRRGHEDVLKGMEYLNAALAADPGHALAWVALARAWAYMAGFGWAPVAEGYGRAREAAQRALTVEPDLAEGHMALGELKAAHDWDWKGADASLRRALELAPGNADVLRAAGGLACDLGRLEEAAMLGRRAVEQDPLSSGAYMALGHAYRLAGMNSDAEEAIRRALEFAPQRVAGRMVLSVVLLLQGRTEDALAEAEQEREEWARLSALAVVQHARGRREEADGALADLTRKYGNVAGLQIAAVHAFRGDTEAAFEWLESAYRERDPGLASMKREPLFLSLHSDPRWGAFLKKMGLED
jgi:serine/threonine protein kinase/tetratricopeptide (TPR) repeat protein